MAVLLPLVSFFGILFFAKPGKGASFAIANISLSFLISAFLFSQLYDTPFIHDQIHWFTIGTLTFNVGLLLNNLTILMLPLITGIALLVHIYSLQYMRGDAYLHRYWAYLGLFCASMMALVVADNLFVIYMCWELVGFSSYLLIGFWFTKETATRASKKAFIVNRIGDIGFLIGLMILISQFQTLDILALFGDSGLVNESVIENGTWKSNVSEMPAIWMTIAGAALLLGAIAKSAQFPLHTWLPDAMEGPTAVSSLIHAATMVAAGVFLLARVYPVFDPFILNVIVVIGGFTAFMAATIALVQNDIKKVLAFSTISQLGFMVLAMGVGAYNAGIFHLVTHAFFKCLLFLAAGAVIHEMHHLKEKHKLDFDIQDMNFMGGLKKFMPVTFITMTLAALALVGIPFTSGYLSKDAILIQAFEWAADQTTALKIIPYLALITSWLTAFYIAKLIFKVFFGELRLAKLFNSSFSLHEAPGEMRYPLMILAALCLFPVFSLNPFSFEEAWIFKTLPIQHSSEEIQSLHIIIPWLVSIIAVGVIYVAYYLYVKRDKQLVAAGSIRQFLSNQWYFDKLYTAVFVNPVVALSGLSFQFDRKVVDGFVNLLGHAGVLVAHIFAWFDTNIVDGIVNFTGRLAQRIGDFARHFQTGRLQHYLATMLLIILTFFILKYFTLAI